MRVQTLVLRSFRSHQETVLELDRFNFIRGPNGCGKSSIQMALEYLLTGRCKLTDAAGRGAEALIRSGDKELEVSATLGRGETICRRRTPRSQIIEINGKRVPADAAETFLTKQFGSTDVLSALLNADRFVEMSEAEQQMLLAQLVDAGKVDIPEEISDALRAINEEPPPKLPRVSDVEAAHRRFYDLRTEASRALKALGHMEKPDVPSDLASVQEVRNKLEELRQQKERLIAQKAEADTCWQNAQARLRQLQAEIEEASSEILSPRQEEELLQLESQRSHAEKLRQELTDLIAEQRTVEKALTTAQTIQDKCPTCGQPISAAARAKEVETLSQRLSDLEGLIQGTREEFNEYGDLKVMTSRLETHRRAVARRAKLLEEQSKVQAVQKPDAAEIESRMTILSERINKGERVLEKAKQSEVAKERWEAYARDKSVLETRICLLERLTEFFGPNGAMMQQASSRMEPFKEKLNRQLAVFGYTCNLTLEPFEIRITSSPHGPGLPLKQLSESERFRFSIAFQLALARTTGIRFVAIDGADVLDKERRKLLTALLLHGDIDQAIVLATGEEPPPIAIPAGVKFFDLTKPSLIASSSSSVTKMFAGFISR
jgi:DNA repair exonuclease SbcCD ATPase subunit